MNYRPNNNNNNNIKLVSQETQRNKTAPYIGNLATSVR